jgi:hypothetical protein
MAGFGEAQPPAAEQVHIVSTKVFKQDYMHGVSGLVYNSADVALKDVTITFYLYHSHMGKVDKGWGTLVAATGGRQVVHFDYLPPKATLPFSVQDQTAPSRTPDPPRCADSAAPTDDPCLDMKPEISASY